MSKIARTALAVVIALSSLVLAGPAANPAQAQLLPAAPAVTAETVRSGITPLVPARLVDTRGGSQTIDGKQSGAGIQPANGTFLVDIAGRGGIPGERVSAVMLNVTIVSPEAPGFAVVYPAGSARPLASSVNYTTGAVVANQVFVKLDATGRAAIYHLAATHLVVDVVGWADEEGVAPTLVPARLLDTRAGNLTVDGSLEGIGRLGADRSVAVTVLGRGGVPLTGVGTVMITVTAVSPTADGFLTVYPDGADRPNASNVNYPAGPGVAVANQVITTLGSNGQFRVYTLQSADVVVDVVGWFPDDSDVAAFTPARLLDTRAGGQTVDGVQAGEGSLSGGTVIDVKVGGRSGVAGGAGSVLLNVAAVNPLQDGFLTVYPTQDDLPLASNLNYRTGRTVANQVLVQLGDGGMIRVYSNADTDVVIDVAAWLPPGLNQINPDVVALTGGGAQVALASGGYRTGAATFQMPAGAELEVDDIVVLEDTRGLPFYGRVSDITGSTVRAIEVTLGEVIPSGSFDFVANAETGIIGSNAFGAAQSSARIHSAVASLSATAINVGSTTVECTGGSVAVDFDVNGLSFSGSADWGAFYIKAEAYYTPSISLTATGKFADGGSCTATKTLFTKDLPTIRFSIGPVPIVITHELSLDAEVSVAAEGELTITAGATASAKVGAKYDGSLRMIKEFDLNRRFSLDSKDKATFEVALVASYSAALYGVVGFSAWIKPSVRTVIDPAATKWVTATAQIEAGLTAQLTFKVDVLLTSVGFSESVELARGTIWGPVEIYSRDRTRTLPMNSTIPAEAVVGQPVTGTVSLPSGVPAGSTVTWNGELPAGFTLTPNPSNSSIATVTGTPTSTTPLSFTIDADVLPPGKLALNSYADKTINISVVPAFSAGTQAVGIGEVNRPFEGTVIAQGGKAPYTWSATGLPAGVSLAATTTNTPVNVLVGTTPTAQSGSAQIRISDSSVAPDIETYVSWTVFPAVTISAPTFPAGNVGQVYSQSVTIVGGTDGVSHTVSGVPYGLNVIRSGRTITVAGTPLVAGPQAYRVDVRSRLGNTAAVTRYFAVRPALALSTTVVNLPVGSAATQPVDGWVSVAGGTGPYTWAFTDLPAGVTFDAAQTTSRVRLAGSMPTAGVRTIGVTVSDAIGSTPAIGTIALRAVQGASFATTTFGSGAVNGVYSGSVEVSGGRAPYELKAVGLPRGVSVAKDGDNRFVMSGTPTLAGTYQTQLELTDASGRPAVSQVVTITIQPALKLVDGELPNGVSGTPYAAGSTISVTGGVGPFTWTVTGLPAGLTLDGDPTGPVRTVTGTPQAAGSSIVSISVTDSAGSPAATDTRSFSVTAPLALSTTNAPTKVYTDVDVTGTITSAGGNLPVTFSATGLPAGISMSSSGVISGRPTTGEGTVSVTYTVTDAANYTASNAVSLRVIPAIVVDLSATRTALKTGNVYDGSVGASGGVTPYTYSIAMQDASAVPAFIELDPATGAFVSTTVATTAGTYDLRVTVADSDRRSKTADYRLTVADTEPVTVTVSAPTIATNGTPVSGTATATGGIAPYTFSLVSAPTWLTINAATGAISGTPAGENGAVSFTVKAVGGIFENTKTATMDVRPPLTVNVSGITTTGSAGTNYTGSFSWAGGRIPTVSVTGLPSTLTATSTTSPGSITGRPLTGGTYNVVVSASDPDGRTASATATVTIASAPALALDVTGMPTAPDLTAPASQYSGTATVSGGITAYTWSATGLPAGVTMTSNGTTATFAGRPQSSGTYDVVITVTDGAASSVTKTVTIVVLLEPLSVSAGDLWAIGHVGITEQLGVVTAAGGKAPYTFSATGLPTGFAIDAVTGVVSADGLAAAVAPAATVTIKVTDANSTVVTTTWSLEIKDPVVITKPNVASELSVSAFIPIKLPSFVGTPTFSTMARFPGGTSTTMFTCSLYATNQWGCYGEPTQAAVTLDIFVTDGGVKHGAIRVPMTFTNQSVRDLSLGRNHGCAIYADTTMKCWGGNGVGQLGNAFIGSTAPTFSTEPVYVTDAAGTPTTGWIDVESSANSEAGKEFTCALKKEPKAGASATSTNELDFLRSTWCWGYGLDGQLGAGTLTSSTTPVRVRQSDTKFLDGLDGYDLVVGGTTACAQIISLIRSNGAPGGNDGSPRLTSRCWGAGLGAYAKWEVNSEHYNLVDSSLDRFSDHLAIGRNHTCLTQNEYLYSDSPTLLNGARVSCYGTTNLQGGLGYVDANAAGTEDLYFPQKIAAGRAHTCALMGRSINTSTFAKTSLASQIRCWGDNSSNQIGSTVTGANVLAATGGPAGTYANVNFNTTFEMLAGGDTTCANTLTTYNPLVASKIVCWGSHYAGSTPGTIATIATIANTDLKTVGATAACGKPYFGSKAFWCWGSNTNGQMGLGSNSLEGGTTVAYPANI